MNQKPREGGSTEEYDVVVIGAGVSGMYALHHLREMGLSVHFTHLLFLWFLEQNVSPQHQNVHFCHHETAECVLWRTNNRFTSDVETRIYHHGTLGFLVESSH